MHMRVNFWLLARLAAVLTEETNCKCVRKKADKQFTAPYRVPKSPCGTSKLPLADGAAKVLLIIMYACLRES